MSNVTQDSRNSGDSRRRRSRGGQNRKTNHSNNQQDRRGADRDPRGSRSDRGDQGAQRAEEFRPQAPRPPRKYSPPKLTFWQKVLKAIGLYKEPVRPSRPERKPDAAKTPATEARVKSNTRNVRTSDEPSAAPRENRREGRDGERRDGERTRNRDGNRDNNRARGGDSSTVESARIYVGNLSYDASESDLQDLFKGIGGVRNIEIVYNRQTHRSKGYGFVEMVHIDEARRAVEVLHDQPFMGRKMTVSGAKSKGQDDREDLEERAHARPDTISVAIPAAAKAAEAETLPEAGIAPEVTAAVHNVEAVGAPQVIVDAVEHQVTEAVEGERTEDKPA